MPLIPGPSLVQSGGGGAMAQLYDNIASGAIASWDVSSISQAYNHLQILFAGRADNAVTAQVMGFRLNNDSSASYYTQRMDGVATSVSGTESIGNAAGLCGDVAGSSAPAGMVGGFILTIFDYKSTTFNKAFASQVMSQWGTSTGTVRASAFGGTWNNTAAVNRFYLFPNAGNFVAGSRLTIYGLL